MIQRITTALLFLCLCLLLPASVSAASKQQPGYDPFQGACAVSGQANNQATACNKNKTTIIGPGGIIKKVSNIIALIAAIAAVIVIMIGGLQYIVSDGDSQKTANARMAIIGGAVGLGIIVAAQGIILLVLSRLQ